MCTYIYIYIGSGKRERYHSTKRFFCICFCLNVFLGLMGRRWQVLVFGLALAVLRSRAGATAGNHISDDGGMGFDGIT